MNFTGKQQGDLLPEKITDYRQFDAILSKHREMKKMMKETRKIILMRKKIRKLWNNIIAELILKMIR
ncbi:hypothetical protein CV093_00835 [Oceanobacillus sp. 143]|nr:hypothetical protein CV093_00835 [Oceanobacillus sp. 143]